MTAFALAITAAAGANPMAPSLVPIVRQRTLLIDGDGLAYYCAGNSECEPGQARQQLLNKISTAKAACGAEHVKVLLTSRGSHKGHRYAVATVKPYQGQRANSRRPENWEYLRSLMESAQVPFQVETTATAEADDLFGKFSHELGSESVVIYTQDKDMRMVPGWHLDWVNHRMVHVPLECYRLIFNDKTYGRKWFWLQMLHGDTADNIPGLPKYVVDGKTKSVGEVTANKLLAGTLCEEEASLIVASLYEGYYGEGWLTHLYEQAILLWMRRRPDVWQDCAFALGPLASLFSSATEEQINAIKELRRRVNLADSINNAAANGHIINEMAGGPATP